MPVTIEEGRIDGLATAPVFTKEERADATINPEERNNIQNLREQRLMDMLEHICVEVSNMSKAIQNLNLAQQPKPDLWMAKDKLTITTMMARINKLETDVAKLQACTAQPWQPKGYPAPPYPNYDPTYRHPRVSDNDPYDPANYNTGFTGFGK